MEFLGKELVSNDIGWASGKRFHAGIDNADNANGVANVVLLIEFIGKSKLDGAILLWTTISSMNCKHLQTLKHQIFRSTFITRHELK